MKYNCHAVLVWLFAMVLPAAVYAQSPSSSSQTPIVGGTPGNLPSGNNTVAAQTPDTTTASTALGALNATIAVALEGQRGAAFQLQAAGTGVYTVTPQCSFDGGTLYPANGWIADPISGATSLTATISSAQATTDYPVLCPTGSSHAQMKVTAYTSGTANWLARATVISPIAVVYGSDGANIQALPIEPPSESPVLADPSVVVAQSPNPAPVCTGIIAVNQTASTDVKTFTNFGFICTVKLISATAQNISIVEGTGAVCATGIAAIDGGTTASNAVPANGGWSLVSDRPWLKLATSGDHLCILQSGAGNVSGVITYQDHI
jgi:hypothetical protein